MTEFSPFLYARPSFIEGVSRILDFGGTLSEYNRSATPTEADYWAFYSDVLTVGDDIRRGAEAADLG